MKHTVGFIGTGNMGGALARAAAKAVAPDTIFLADQQEDKAKALADALGCRHAAVTEVAQQCSTVFLGVKPQVMGTLLGQLSSVLAARQDSFVLVSMAAGISIADIQKMAGSNYPVIRIMPNIPVSVGSGMILYDASENVSESDLQAFCAVMAQAGLVDRLPEKLIDAGSALSGCGPAFVSLFIEALADGAVTCGLSRQQALSYACQTLIGTAQMVQTTGIHPGALKDAVCSPGGSTIAGVAALEGGAFRASVMDAVISAYERTRELGN